jgi:hypothetical protein
MAVDWPPFSLRQPDYFLIVAPTSIREHEIGQMRLYQRSFTNKKTQNRPSKDKAGAGVPFSTQAE